MYTLKIWSFTSNWWMVSGQYDNLDDAVNACEQRRFLARVTLSSTDQTVFQNE